MYTWTGYRCFIPSLKIDYFSLLFGFVNYCGFFLIVFIAAQIAKNRLVKSGWG